MKFREIIKFELVFQLGRYLMWIFFVAVLGLSFLSAYSMIDSVKAGDYFLNSPVVIAVIVAISSTFCLLISAAVAGNAGVRDLQTGIHPLIYTTSLKKLSYLGGRFLASFLINIGVLIIILGLLFLFSIGPWGEEFFMPNRFVAYISAFLIFAIPNAFIGTAILFSFAVITRSAMVSFLAAGLFFFLSLFSMDILAGELGLWELGKRLDLSGMTVLKELRLIQTPLEIPVQLVQFNSSLLENRLIWMGVGILCLSLAYFRFNFAHYTSGRKKRSEKNKFSEISEKREIWSTPAIQPVDHRIFNLKAQLQQYIFLSTQTFKELMKGKVWLILVGILGIVFFAAEEVMEGQLGVPISATSWRSLLLMKMMGMGLAIPLLITFYAGELVWKERDLRIDEISDVAPVPNWVIFLSKFTALFFLIMFLQALVMAAGIIVQVMQGNYEIDLWLYLSVLFGFKFLDLVIFSVVAFLVHVLVNQKYIAYLVVVLVFFYMYFPGLIGLQHNLLIFGSGPEIQYSDISRFDPYINPWLWFKLFWIGWGILLALVIHCFWNRGKESYFSKRISKAKMNISQATARMGIPAIIMIFFLGGFIFYNTNILNKYITSKEGIERRVLYEQKYGKYDRVPQPLLSGIKLNGEIYPEKRKVEIQAEYKLINKSNVEIDTIHVSTTSGTEIFQMVFNQKSQEILIDTDLGHRIYKLDKALKPGDSIALEFKVIFDQKGFSNSGIDKAVVKNGTYLGYHLMPNIGYQTHREVSDTLERQKYNLPPQPAVRSVHDQQARMDLFGEQQLTFEAVLGTSEEQTAITAGTFQKSWTENGRRYFHYKTDAPIRHNYEIFSAVYEVHKTSWKNVEIRIYYHPEHTKNLERMSKGMIASLEYFSKNFSPYPHKQMNLVEYPGSGVGLNGNPVTMSYSEGFSLFDMEKEHREMDFPFAVTAHEVAHQWWGGEIRPAYVEGSPLLTESLAWYSSMMLVEDTFGKDHLDLLVRILRQEYLSPRSPADVPLLRATDDFAGYRKGPFAMYAIKNYIGGEKVNLALRRLLEKFDSGEPPLPTSLDLYTELKTVTPDSLQYLLKDLFERNSYWKLKAEKAVATPAEGGKWNVSFKVTTGKDAMDEKGNVTNLSMNDYVEIAVYANSPEGELGELLYLKKHQLKSGEQTINLTISKKPDLAGIDPNRLLIDQEVNDNFIQIKSENLK